MDYFLRPKPAYYAIARELRAYTVGAARTEHKTHPSDTSAAQLALETRVALWGANATLEPRRATLAVAAFDLGDARWTAAFEVRDVVLAPNAATELWAGALPGQPVRTKLSEVPRAIVLAARLLDADGTVLARHANWCVCCPSSLPRARLLFRPRPRHGAGPSRTSTSTSRPRRRPRSRSPSPRTARA